MKPAILRRVEALGYATFSGLESLNLIAERSPGNMPDAFDDLFHAVMMTNAGWLHRIYACTTDPGAYWLRNPGRVDGTAIIAPGQYRGAYREGLHKGRYPALVQCGPVDVFRDRSQDGTPDATGPRYTGLYGVNIHRANADRTSTVVDKWSAGCIVLPDRRDHDELLTLYRRSATRYGALVTLTLI